MKIITKFNMQEEVFLIQNIKNKKWLPCSFCAGCGVILGADNATRQCPQCYGNKGSMKYDEKPSWQITQKLTIGEVQITSRDEYNGADEDNLFDNYGNQKTKYEERYMCYETGIGSGTLWKREDLFKLKIDAAQECDRRNHDTITD